MNYSDRQLALLRNRMGENIQVPPKRKKRDNAESRAQCAFFEWWGLNCEKKYGIPECLLFAVPNGGMRSAQTGAILKREGVRKGTPDCFLSVARGPWHGLYLEFKAEDGQTTAEQRNFMLCATVQSYMCRVVYSCESAMNLVTSYLGYT